MTAPAPRPIAPETSPWMTREEAAEYLRIAPRTFDNYVRAGEITRFRLKSSDRPRYRRAEVVRLIEIDDKVGQRATPNLVKATEASLQSRGHETGPRPLTG